MTDKKATTRAWQLIPEDNAQTGDNIPATLFTFQRPVRMERGTTMPAETLKINPNKAGQYVLPAEAARFAEQAAAMEKYAEKYKLHLMILDPKIAKEEGLDGPDVIGEVATRFIPKAPDSQQVVDLKERVAVLENKVGDVEAERLEEVKLREEAEARVKELQKPKS